VEKGLLIVAGWVGLGGILSELVWFGFYTWWSANPYYAKVFLISALAKIIILFLYLRFIKFMERP